MQAAFLFQWLQPRRGKHIDEERLRKYELWQEIRKAHAEWRLAQDRLDYVVENDQIDYAIYALEAAEKRYEMLLKAAKRAKLSLVDSDRVTEVGM
ncbi:hypothetical protein SD70_25205 [Gordoniibacillus kamchatkensis]|uniref:DUF2508 domain-containing protein n=1 Tax=Gordoniibacillus kamchatkensis TaxID=1590651 RepID=A0ABR5AD44_9BACL|nr:DUF2508 family protein [Paenibacillus sp. VKM B-2647]KIL38598.1 hypothetical protein SD70_25205 [Paenibacillus sp. VKM B-2647]